MKCKVKFLIFKTIFSKNILGWIALFSEFGFLLNKELIIKYA